MTKYYIFSIKVVFGLNLVSKQCSDFRTVVKMYLVSKYEILHPKYVNAFTCSNAVLQEADSGASD
jgi:hypothetical protein